VSNKVDDNLHTNMDEDKSDDEMVDKKEIDSSDDEEKGLKSGEITKKGDYEEIDADKLIDRPEMKFDELSESDMSIFEFEEFNKKVEEDGEDVKEDLFENQDTQFEIPIDEDNDEYMISSGRGSNASFKVDMGLGTY